MKSVWVLIIIAFTICSGCKVRAHQEDEGGPATEDTIISLLPLKLLLEYRLKTQREFKQIAKDQQDFQQTETGAEPKAENLRSPSPAPEQNTSTDGLCTTLGVPKNVSLPEILNILSSDADSKDVTLSKEELQKVYNSLRDCFFIKVRNAKLWGPLWHCLNRLFLFFVFN